MNLGIALSGGSIYGAYQVGVLRYLVDRFNPEVKIAAGTSAGAINASIIAAFAGDLPGAVSQAERSLDDLDLDTMLHPIGGFTHLVRYLRWWGWVGQPPEGDSPFGLFEHQPFRDGILAAIPFDRIVQNLAHEATVDL